MIRRATALLYSSHDRCEHIHRDWIVERALQSHDNKTVFYIPFSYGRTDQQDYGWGTFRWYFSRFEQWGLRPSSFYWNQNLRKEDADIFFSKLYSDEVVILGGGNSQVGMERYIGMGARFYDEPGMFHRILHERQSRGKLTAGFSAGSDQLGQHLQEAAWEPIDQPHGFALARNVMTTLHHERGREGDLLHIARHAPHCLVFGLPNDSGLAIDQGYTPGGNIWQIIQVVIDNSWDSPRDSFHIKTRAGMAVEHYTADGRHWSFNGGDRVVRIMAPDNRWQRNFINPAGTNRFIDHLTHDDTGFSSAEQIVAHH